MSDAHRESTADCLNGSVLWEHRVPPSCAIERLLRQLLAVSLATREANLGYGHDVKMVEDA